MKKLKSDSDNILDIPHYLKSAVALLKDADITNVPPIMFEAMIRILSEHLSHRNLGHIIAKSLDTDYAMALNLVYRIESSPPSEAIYMDEAAQRLRSAGFDEWVDEN